MFQFQAARSLSLAVVPVLLAVLPSICLVGCQRPAPPQGITAASLTEDELDVFWEAALSVLRKHDLRPDRQDRAMGVIETLGTTSRQWSEFWRQDVADWYSLAHASLHTTQRKATVRFVRGADDWAIEVQVDVYRLSVPDSQITSASSVIQGFSGVLPTTEGELLPDPQARRRWVHLGRDAAMESRLLDRILRRATW
jgi:hypothetical protein